MTKEDRKNENEYMCSDSKKILCKIKNTDDLIEIDLEKVNPKVLIVKRTDFSGNSSP